MMIMMMMMMMMMMTTTTTTMIMLGMITLAALRERSGLLSVRHRVRVSFPFPGDNPLPSSRVAVNGTPYQIYWINNNIPDSAHFWPSRLKSAWTLPPPCDWWYSLMLIALNVCVVDFFHLYYYIIDSYKYLDGSFELCSSYFVCLSVCPLSICFFLYL